MNFYFVIVFCVAGTAGGIVLNFAISKGYRVKHNEAQNGGGIAAAALVQLTDAPANGLLLSEANTMRRARDANLFFMDVRSESLHSTTPVPLKLDENPLLSPSKLHHPVREHA